VLFRLLPYNRSFIKPAFAGMVALGAGMLTTYWLPDNRNVLYLAVQIMLVFAVYGLVNLALGLAPEDRAMLLRIYQRARGLLARNRVVLTRFVTGRLDRQSP
jgi:hypothetical protein